MLPKVTILRHAEKQLGDQPPFSVGPDGIRDPESLSVRGWQRAGALVGLFVPRPEAATAPSLPTPTHLFASRVGETASKSRRPRQTLEPLSERLGIDIDGRFLKAQVDELVAAIRTTEGVAVVAWEHKMIPLIGTLLAGDLATNPSVWPDNRYDLLWMFEPDESGTGYRFRQVPQMLLAGDRAQTI